MNSKENPNSLSLHNELREESKQSSSKRKYMPVDYDKRKELLRIINEENLTIKTAAERLRINYSNAKSIVKLYKKESRIYKLPKKPKLTLNEITNPFYFRDNIPFKEALLPFYDLVSAQPFMAWSKSKHTKLSMDFDNISANSVSRKSIMEERRPRFSFEIYRPEIESRSFL